MENMTETAIISSFGDLWYRRARAGRDVGIPGRIDDPLREDGLAAGLALGDDAARSAPFSRIGATPRRCSSGLTPASSTSTSATHLNISASSAWLRDCGSGIAAPMALARGLELDADPLAVHGVLVAVPCEALDPHLGDVAAEAAVAIDERGARARTRRRQRRRQAAGAAADDQHIGFQDDIDRTGGLGDFFHSTGIPDWGERARAHPAVGEQRSLRRFRHRRKQPIAGGNALTFRRPTRSAGAAAASGSPTSAATSRSRNALAAGADRGRASR